MYRNHYADELSLMTRLDDLNKQAYRPSRQGPSDGKELVRAGRRALPRRLAALLASLLS